jgi:hypothetical protein
MNKTQSEIKRVVKSAGKAAEEWVKSKEDIAGEIKSLLDSKLEEVTMKLLGFNNRYGEWEIDHCNGRFGDSAAGDWLRDKAGDAVNAWLTKQAGNLPELPKTAIKSLRENYLSVLENQLRVKLTEKAKADSDAILKSALFG